MNEETKYRYWLKAVPKLRNKTRRKLIEYCGSAKEIYGLSEKQLKSLTDWKEAELEEFLLFRKNWELEKEAEKLLKQQISIITTEEEEFPQRLRNIYDCPYALFYKGNMPKNDEPSAAVVGARICSSYGKQAALVIGKTLAEYGVNVVSGMAMGIDSFGHWGTLGAGGKTFAVLGCGVNVCYPKGARELYDRILEKQGGILSEYLPNEPPLAYRFPERNRIISGLSDRVIVVEAKKKSGSLITADFALEQGKEIFAVPGRLDDLLSEGCNELIEQGAGILLSMENFPENWSFVRQKNGGQEEKKKNLLEKEESLVYSCFDLHEKNMEELVRMTDIPPSKMADILVRLQNKGWIRENFKNSYIKK